MIRNSHRHARLSILTVLTFGASVRPDARRTDSTRLHRVSLSFAPVRHMTGPSLARVWGRKGAADGPPATKPVIVGNGMHGDRAAVVFSRPEEITLFVRRQCA